MVEEIEAIQRRYSRRNHDDLYSVLRPEVWLSMQERQRALIGLFAKCAARPLNQLRLLEIGCGTGSNLQELVRLGFDPGNLVGNDLLPERVAAARSNLPQATRVLEGDATQLPLSAGEFDIVYQSTVFTSILDDAFQLRLADRMWAWVRPGGGILWYDFIYDNPRNPDVKGVPIARIRELFPAGQMDLRRVTLAPPISRRVARWHPWAYHAFNVFPFMRTHVLCWIHKRTDGRDGVAGAR